MDRDRLGVVPARESVPPLGEVLEVVRLVWALEHGLQTASRQMESTLGLTGRQRLVLRLVGRFPGIAVAQLAEVLHVPSRSLAGTLQRLERRGLLGRRVDPHAGRGAFLELTEPGRQLDLPHGDTVEAVVRRVLEGLPRSRVSAAREVLAALARALESAGLVDELGDVDRRFRGDLGEPPGPEGPPGARAVRGRGRGRRGPTSRP